MNEELSGEEWGRKFPGSTNTRDLSGNFRLAVEEAIGHIGLTTAIKGKSCEIFF